MTHWLYPANTKFYDVLGAFAEKETFWPISSKVAVDDTVYIYLAAPHKQLGFVSYVKEIGLAESAVLDKVRPFFLKAPEGSKKDKLFMKLKVSKRIALDKGSLLSLEFLKPNGLNGMLMGPRKLENNPALLTYIQGVTG